MTRRSIITRAAVCLALGLVTTVGVAWGFGQRFEGNGGHIAATVRVPAPDGDGQVSVHTTVFWSAWATDCVGLLSGGGDIKIVLPASEVNAALAVKPIRTDGERRYFARLPWWLAGDRPVTVPGVLDMHLAQGWPVRCVRGVYSYKSRSASGLIRVRTSINPVAGQIAIVPIWKGLAANTGVFAALWAVPVFGWPIVKTRRRRKRGLCVACGYDLGGNLAAGCPECGWGK